MTTSKNTAQAAVLAAALPVELGAVSATCFLQLSEVEAYVLRAVARAMQEGAEYSHQTLMKAEGVAQMLEALGFEEAAAKSYCAIDAAEVKGGRYGN